MSNLLSKKIVIPVVAVLIVAGGCAWYFTHNYSSAPQNQPTKTSFVGNPDNTSADNKKSQASNNSDVGNPNSDQSSKQNVATASKPQTPTGNFVSNHYPNLSGSPAPNTENSVCITSVGATCRITFTQGSAVKSLESKTVGSNGAVIWNWKLQDIGLTPGTWKIAAVASNGDVSSTSSDPLVLAVGN